MEQFVTIFAVLVGWGLNEFSQLYKSTKEHKQAISSALSILLEVRFQTIYLEDLLALYKELGFPRESSHLMRAMMDKSGIRREDLIEQYETALNIIAKSDPLIAYEYRSKASLPKIIRSIKEISVEHGVKPQDFDPIESRLNSQVIPRLNELVLELATLHSRKLKLEVQKIVEKRFETTSFAEDLLDSINDNNAGSERTEGSHTETSTTD